MSYIVDQQGVIDPFGSAVQVQPLATMTFSPTWGISDLRYAKTTTGTGAAVTETGGEFKLSTGTAAGNVAQIRTLKRGLYQSGSMGQFGTGVRIPNAPVSTQFHEWGYNDTQNGFLFGYDATSPYVVVRSAGVDTKVPQAEWNVDKLDGTGPSGLVLDLAKGVVCEGKFVYYGFGTINYGFLLYDSDAGLYTFRLAHIAKVDFSVSVIDPNQPLTFRSENGGSATSNADMYIGGHQFEILAAIETPNTRDVSEVLSNYTTALNTDWQPIMAVRGKATHGPSGRANSVYSTIRAYQVAADNELETRITFKGVTSNLTFGPPTGWTAAESAIETKVTGATALTASTAGYPSAYGFVTASRQVSGIIEKKARLPLSTDIEGILWVRRLTATGTIIVKQASITVEESW